MDKRIMERRKRIALVAHDNKKAELIEWAIFNKITLSRHRLYATGTTGAMLEEVLDQSVTKLQSGPLGGDLQIGAKIAEGKLDVLIFFSIQNAFGQLSDRFGLVSCRRIRYMKFEWHIERATNLPYYFIFLFR